MFVAIYSSEVPLKSNFHNKNAFQWIHITKINILPIKTIWLTLFCALLLGTQLITLGFQNQGFMILASTSVVLFLFFSEDQLHTSAKIFISTSIILFLFSYFNSAFVTRSITTALIFSTSAIVFATLGNPKIKLLKLIGWKTIDLINSVKIIVLVLAILHACVLVLGYLMFPDMRWTGLFRDYSQSAFFILIVWGLTYPLFKYKSIGVGITVVLFLGFFSSFSRSANFILVVFIALLLFFEFKKSNLLVISKHIVCIFLSLLILYIYPIIIEFEMVDRGGVTGLSDIGVRLKIWMAAIESIARYPLFGIGLGNFENSGIKPFFPFVVIFSVHNDYLQIFTELGVFWFIAFVGFILYILATKSPFKKLTLLLSSETSNKFQERQYIAWSIMFCMCLYMSINFMISFFNFQLLVVLCLLDLYENHEF